MSYRAPFIGTCPTCGKRCFVTRRTAKTEARRLGGHMHVYRCGDWWHYGHPPTALIRGKITRDQITTRPGAS